MKQTNQAASQENARRLAGETQSGATTKVSDPF
jgi:hypothetical protein